MNEAKMVCDNCGGKVIHPYHKYRDGRQVCRRSCYEEMEKKIAEELRRERATRKTC